MPDHPKSDGEGVIPGPDPGACEHCGAWRKAGMVHTCPVPDDRHPGYVWPSWREAIADAAAGIEHAVDRRRRVMRAAFDAGLTLRQIGEAAGMSAAGVHKIIGRQRAASLDAPAFSTFQVGGEGS